MPSRLARMFIQLGCWGARSETAEIVRLLVGNRRQAGPQMEPRAANRGVLSTLLPWSAERQRSPGGTSCLKPLPVPDSATLEGPLFGFPQGPAAAFTSLRCTPVPGLFLTKATALSGPVCRPVSDSSPSSGCQAHDLKQSELSVIVH